MSFARKIFCLTGLCLLTLGQLPIDAWAVSTNATAPSAHNTKQSVAPAVQPPSAIALSLVVEPRDRLNLALQIARDEGDSLSQIPIFGNIALAYHALGDAQTAKSVLEQATAIARQSEYSPGYKLGRIAEYSLQIGDVEYANELLEEALDILELYVAESNRQTSQNNGPDYSTQYVENQDGTFPYSTGAIVQIANVYGQIEDSAIARQGLSNTLSLLQTFPPQGQSAKYIVESLAKSYASLANADAALADLARLYVVALDLLEPQPGDDPDVLNSNDRPAVLSYLAAAHAQQGDLATAESFLVEAVSILKNSDPTYIAYSEQTLVSIALAHRHLENTPTVQQNLTDLTERSQRILAPPYPRPKVSSAIAQTYDAFGDIETAQQIAEAMVRSVTQIPMPSHQIAHLVEVSELYEALDMPVRQQEVIDQATALLGDNLTDGATQLFGFGYLVHGVKNIADTSDRQQQLNDLYRLIEEGSLNLGFSLESAYGLVIAKALGEAELRDELTAILQTLETDSDLSSSDRYDYIRTAVRYFSDLPEGPFRQNGFETLQQYAISLQMEFQQPAADTNLLDVIALDYARIRRF